MSISPQDWHRLFDLLDGMGEPERRAWLERLGAQDDTIKDKLKELLAQRGVTAPAEPLGSAPPLSPLDASDHPSGTGAPTGGSPDRTLLRVRPAAPEGARSKAARSEPRPSIPQPVIPARSIEPSLPPLSDVKSSGSSTDSRWDSPQTWAGAFDEPLRVGSVLRGRYVIERVLGEGGMGTVFLAQDEEENQPFAIKVLKEDFRRHPDSLKALREEVIKSRSLAGPNIVGVYELGRDRSIVYVKMEYLQGKSLDALLDDDFARGMPLTQAWPIIDGVCAGVAYAHDRGVIHSDIKPSNIFVTTAGKAKVLDFGIARAVRAPTKRYDPGDLGALTPTYASCEMLEHQEPDVRDDVYSLACVIYELLTGKHPFARQPATEARAAKARMPRIPGLSRMQNAALARALAFSRESRTPSIEAFHEGLRDTRGGLRRLLVRSAVAVVVVAAIVTGGWYAREQWQRRSADQAYLATKLKPNAELSSEYDPKLVRTLLDMGDRLLSQARREFDARALSEGPTSAYGAYMDVLGMDSANRRAAEGALAVVRLYESKARSLAREQQYKRALELVAIALKLAPDDQPLRELREELVRKVQPADGG